MKDQTTDAIVKKNGLKVAVLQTGRSPEPLRETHGDYDAMCKALLGLAPHEADTFAVLDGEFPSDIDPYDLFLITGSKHGVYEDHSWIAPLEDIIRDAYGKGKKLIGICFGHQIIAQALGGKVVKSDKGAGVGAMEYELRTADGETSSLKLHAWHYDQVVKAPKDAEIIASSDFCEFAGFRYGDKAISFQPHPEFSKDYMVALAGFYAGEKLPEEELERVLSTLGAEVAPGPIQKLITKFVAD